MTDDVQLPKDEPIDEQPDEPAIEAPDEEPQTDEPEE